MTLHDLTYTFNFLALTFSFWLGAYLVTRNPRTPTAWLTAFTVWSLGGLFLNVLLALNPPPVPEYRPSYLRFLFPFWASGYFNEGASAWLQGWSVAPAIVFWHHATLLMRPGPLNLWRKVRVAAGYLVGIAAIEMQAFTQIVFAVEGGDPLYLNSLQAGPLYSFFGLVLIVLTVTCTVNLARSASVAPNETARYQLGLLTIATIVDGLSGPLSLIASGLNLFPVPEVAMSLILAVFIGMIGYGVARYSALVEGRAIRRDFFYNLTLITGITINQEVGGNLSEILSNLEKTMRDRQALKREIAALSSQGRATAVLLSLVPVAVIALQCGTPSSREQFILFARSIPGSMALALCVVVIMAAVFWIFKMIQLKD